jgi:DNA polymerase III sliding clamp (beta) subunit (PCNA family)
MIYTPVRLLDTSIFFIDVPIGTVCTPPAMPFGVWLALPFPETINHFNHQQAHKEALPGLTKIIGRSRTLPVLQTVRITRDAAGKVSLLATDLDSFATYTAKEAQAGPAVDILVPVDQLGKAVKCSSPGEDIGIVLESKDKVKLRYNIAGNTVEQTISTLPADEYPPIPAVRQPGVPLEPGFGQALKETLQCCSDDASRYVLRGACLDVNDKKLHYVVGTNGRMVFSANSFCFNLQKSVIIPDSKFLAWSDSLDEQPALLSVEAGLEAQKAKDGKPAVEAMAAWVKLESPRWSFVTKEIEGAFPNWHQCVPVTSSKWTVAPLSEEAVKQLIQVIPNLPGGDSPNYPVRLRIDRFLNVEGPNKEQDEWTSIPVQCVNVNGNSVSIGLNREYLLKALRFGLNKLEIQDSLSTMIISKGGKQMIISPLNLDGGKTTVASPAPAQPGAETTTPATTATMGATATAPRSNRWSIRWTKSRTGSKPSSVI